MPSTLLSSQSLHAYNSRVRPVTNFAERRHIASLFERSRAGLDAFNFCKMLSKPSALSIGYDAASTDRPWSWRDYYDLEDDKLNYASLGEQIPVRPPTAIQRPQHAATERDASDVDDSNKLEFKKTHQASRSASTQKSAQ